jgi:hypothetical protein
MKFKDFLQKEEQSSGDHGMLGYGKSSSVRKPSDGQPFARYLSSVAGQEPRPNGGGNSGGQAFMKKKMKKHMKKR